LSKFNLRARMRLVFRFGGLGCGSCGTSNTRSHR